MDPAALISEAAKLGFSVLLMAMAVVYFAKRADKSAHENQERMAHALALNRADCVDREAKMSARLQMIEDRQHGETADIVRSATTALEINAKTFEYLARTDSTLSRIKD